MVTVWYALHGHTPDDVAGHRTRARWYTTKTEPSYDDMAIRLRRVINMINKNRETRASGSAG